METVCAFFSVLTPVVASTEISGFFAVARLASLAAMTSLESVSALAPRRLSLHTDLSVPSTERLPSPGAGRLHLAERPFSGQHLWLALYAAFLFVCLSVRAWPSQSLAFSPDEKTLLVCSNRSQLVTIDAFNGTKVSPR